MRHDAEPLARPDRRNLPEAYPGQACWAITFGLPTSLTIGRLPSGIRRMHSPAMIPTRLNDWSNRSPVHAEVRKTSDLVPCYSSHRSHLIYKQPLSLFTYTIAVCSALPGNSLSPPDCNLGTSPCLALLPSRRSHAQ